MGLLLGSPVFRLQARASAGEVSSRRARGRRAPTKQLFALLVAASGCSSAFADSTLILGNASETELPADIVQRMNAHRSKPKEFAEPVAVRIDVSALNSTVIVGNVNGHEYRLIGKLKRDEGTGVEVWSSDVKQADNLTATRTGDRIFGMLSLDGRTYVITGDGNFGVLVEVLRTNKPRHSLPD